MHRCVSKMIELKLRQLDLMDECMLLYADDNESFRDIVKDMQQVYHKLDKTITAMHQKHELADHEVHKLYHDLHRDRAAGINRRIYEEGVRRPR